MISAVFAYSLFSDKKGKDIYFKVNGGERTFVTAQQRQAVNDQITATRNNLITETVKAVSPAVVGINVTEVVQYQDPWASDPFFRQFFGDRSYNQEVKSLGSGTIISPDGYILTNDHVAGNGVKITVTMTNGNHYTARKIGTDPASDICLLKIEGNNLPYIPMGNSDDVLTGEWVIALGNPFGLFEINDQPTVTVGVISAKGMNLEPDNNRYYLGMLQTDAAINRGNSGGPLVNSVGELIGMNTLIYTADGSSGNIGLGFAIPINKIKRIISELKEKGIVDRNFKIGLDAQTIDEGIAEYYKLPSTRGAIITDVKRNSPAEKAGLEAGDIIVEVEGNKIINRESLVGVFQEFRTGQTISLTIIRDKQSLNKKMRLERADDRKIYTPRNG
ncbi:MAG: PDZ domain-containing protein [Ignavibacteria bacterium]|nr:PDZ domain-containing protein [Ignavibacteria bacterium]MCU7501638.1 PDZ domain-containing protein [Ignavibacteria bacterium]MCU7517773.1 PDZ domain-containing protein [Ignavibacteria bacterium]